MEAETHAPGAAKVLVVDDEPGIQKTLTAYLEAEGYAVRTVADGREVLSALTTFKPEVIVLDVMLPGMDGIEVLRRLREASRAYVLMLSARADESDRLVGLRMGADDYVTKPFSPREVVARVGAMLRRGRQEGVDSRDVLKFARLIIDRSARQAYKDERLLGLTPIEFDILNVLAQNAGRVLSRDQMIRSAWGDDYFIEERVVDVHIRRLRQKLEDDPSHARIIVTVRSAGYRFEAAHA